MGAMMIKKNDSMVTVALLLVGSMFLIVTTSLPGCWASSSSSVEGAIQRHNTAPLPPSNPTFRGGGDCNEDRPSVRRTDE